MDKQTFKDKFLPHHRKLFAFALRLTGNNQDAEDVLQETYIKLWERRKQLWIVENTEAYSMTLLKNTCLDFLRKNSRLTEQLEQSGKFLAGSNSFVEQIEQRDQIEQVQFLLRDLPEQQRRVVYLKLWEEYSDEEIEQATGLSRGNIRVIVARVKRKIKEYFLKGGAK